MHSLSGRILQRFRSHGGTSSGASHGSLGRYESRRSRKSSDSVLMEPAIIDTLSRAQCELWLSLHGVDAPLGISSEDDLRKMVAEHAGLNYHRRRNGLIKQRVRLCGQCSGPPGLCQHDEDLTENVPGPITINDLSKRALKYLFEHLSGQRSGKAILWGDGGDHRPLAEVNKTFLEAYYASIKLLRIQNTEAKDGEVLSFLSKCGSNVEHLVLYQCPYVTDATLASLQIYCPKIKSLEIILMKRVLDAGIKDFAEAYGSQIQKVKLSLCTLFTHQCLHSLGLFCNSLKELHLSQIPVDVGDEGLSVLLRAAGPTLECLFIDSCEGVSDKSLMTGSIYCSDLKSITLKSLKKITNRGVIALTDKAGGRLEKLDLSKSTNITDMTVAWVGKRNYSLKEVSISGLCLVGDEGVCEMCQLLKDSLKQLDISGNMNITDISLVAIGRYSISLVELKVSRVVQITDYGIIALCKGGGSHLKVLDISNNGNVTPVIFDTILTHNINLNVLNISGRNKISHRALKKVKGAIGSRFQLICE